MLERESEPIRIRLSIRWKIVLPFMLLALLLGLGAVILVNRRSSQADEVRFLRQLRDSGQQAADEVVRVEAGLLEVERTLANTEGVPEAVALADAEGLRDLLLQSVVNSDTDVAVVLDREGESLLAIRRSSPDATADYLTLRGEDYYADWPFVRRVLTLEAGQGASDGPVKLAGLETIDLSGESLYVFFVAGPLVDEQGTVFGAVLVGRYLTNLVRDLGDIAGAHVSIYMAERGDLLATDYAPQDPKEPEGLQLDPELATVVNATDSGEDPYRTITVAGQTYGEVLTPFAARNGEVDLGLLGISLLGGEDTDVASEQIQQQSQNLILFAALSLVLIIGMGLLVSSWITRPIDDLTTASHAVATGNLETYVPERGVDEIGALARTFNRMVDGIRQEDKYRDLVIQSPTESKRSALRRTLANGDRLLEGQQSRATVLFAVLESMAAAVERADPVAAFRDLNVAYQTMLPILNRHGGILDDIGGAGLKAYFGVFPYTAPLAVSSLQAVHAGMALLDFVRELNEARAAAGRAPHDIAVGISTGWLITGGVEALGKIHLTALGPTTHHAQLIARAAAAKPGSALLISTETHRALSSARDHLEFGRRGELPLNADGVTLGVVEVIGRRSRLIDTSDLITAAGGAEDQSQE